MNNKTGFTNLRYIDRLWIVAPILLSFTLLCLTPLREGDTWWHIKVGEEIIQSKAIPEVDSFSSTAAGLPFYFSRSWLSDVILFITSQLGGVSALVLLQAIIGSITIAISFFTGVRRGAEIRFASLAVMIGFLGLYPFSTSRPVIFSFLCFSSTLWVLYSYRFRNLNRLWILPVVMLLWVNLNSAWLTGLFLVGLFTGLNLIEAIVKKYSFLEIRSLVFWSLLTLLVILINPQGPGIWEDIFTATSNPINQIYVSEWQPTTITVSFAWPYFLIIGLLVISLVYSKNRLDWIELVLLLVFLGLSLRYQRLLPFFYLIVIPTLGILWSGITLSRYSNSQSRGSQTNRERSMGYRWLSLTIILLSILIAIFSIPQVRLNLLDQTEAKLVGKYFPSGAADYIASQPEDDLHLFSQPEWGGYLIWRLYPQGKVFVDGRVEQYPLSVWRDYYTIASAGDNWLGILDEYQVDYVILNKDVHYLLIDNLIAANFDCPYEDSVSVVCTIKQ